MRLAEKTLCWNYLNIYVWSNEHYGDKVHIFKTYIPNTVKVGEANYLSQSILHYETNGKAANAYRAFANEIESDIVTEVIG